MTFRPGPRIRYSTIVFLCRGGCAYVWHWTSNDYYAPGNYKSFFFVIMSSFLLMVAHFCYLSWSLGFHSIINFPFSLSLSLKDQDLNLFMWGKLQESIVVVTYCYIFRNNDKRLTSIQNKIFDIQWQYCIILLSYFFKSLFLLRALPVYLKII